MENPNQSSIPIDSGNFGRPIVLKTDSQRFDVGAETAFNFSNMVSIPSVGILADLVFWINLSALYFRLVISAYLIGLSAKILILFLFLTILLLVAVFAITFRFNPKYFAHIFYRVVLLFIGFLVSTQLGL